MNGKLIKAIYAISGIAALIISGALVVIFNEWLTPFLPSKWSWIAAIGVVIIFASLAYKFRKIDVKFPDIPTGQLMFIVAVAAMVEDVWFIAQLFKLLH